VVAVLLHLGYYAASNVTCNPLIARFYAQVNLLPPQEQYLSATRNAVRSRCWFAKTEGCSFQVRARGGGGDGQHNWSGSQQPWDNLQQS
jgi:hypothetical protein